MTTPNTIPRDGEGRDSAGDAPDAHTAESPRLTLDHITARALTDAGYMELAEYRRRVDENGWIPAHPTPIQRRAAASRRGARTRKALKASRE